MRLVLLSHDGYHNDSKLNCVKDIWRHISDIPWSEVDLIKLGYAHIFRENKSKDYLYGLIENVIKILKIIDDEGTLNDIAYIETIKNKAITKYMVLYLASQTCKDTEKVLNIYMSL